MLETYCLHDKQQLLTADLHGFCFEIQILLYEKYF